METLTLIYDHEFRMKSINMVVCKKSPEVILVFEHDVKFFLFA